MIKGGIREVSGLHPYFSHVLSSPLCADSLYTQFSENVSPMQSRGMVYPFSIKLGSSGMLWSYPRSTNHFLKKKLWSFISQRIRYTYDFMVSINYCCCLIPVSDLWWEWRVLWRVDFWANEALKPTCRWSACSWTALITTQAWGESQIRHLKTKLYNMWLPALCKLFSQIELSNQKLLLSSQSPELATNHD